MTAKGTRFVLGVTKCSKIDCGDNCTTPNILKPLDYTFK